MPEGNPVLPPEFYVEQLRRVIAGMDWKIIMIEHLEGGDIVLKIVHITPKPS